LIPWCRENKRVTGGSRELERTDQREHVRPSVTRADEVIANASGENFPVALRMIPARYRAHLFALYCFARLTDDLGDQARERQAPGQAEAAQARTGQAEAGQAGEDTKAFRLKLLDDFEADIDRIYNCEQPLTPALLPLADTVRACDIPQAPFNALIQANRQDQLVGRYATYAELEQYCTLSANPVGQIVLYIFDSATPERIEMSDKICTALQLVEHWQDVAEDLGYGRIYLPQDDMARFGVTEQDLAAATANAKVKDLLRFEVARARQLLDDGAPLVGTLHGAARLAVAGYVGGGRAALAAVERAGYDVLASTPKPRKPTLLRELGKTYLRGR
jgi:squalene synthase HpnC